MALNFAFRFPSNRKFFSKINGPQKFQHPFKQNSNFITNKPQFLTFRSFSSPSEQDIQIFRKKCLFHSRERGILENCLLLGSFAEKHLNSMNVPQLEQYAQLLQQMDHDIFKWITEKESPPIQFDNEVMKLVKEHVKKRQNFVGTH